VLFYEGGGEGFLQGTLPLIRHAIAAGDPILIAVGPDKLALLEEALGDDVHEAQLVDMRALGRNPARIIPAWHEFLRGHADGRCSPLGIGEPIWPGRSQAELSECHIHESLLNLAFGDGPGWHLLCPYDLDGLEDAVIESAQRNHPFVAASGVSEHNVAYVCGHPHEHPLEGTLPPPLGPVRELRFAGEHELVTVRRFFSGWAAEQRLPSDPTEALTLAVNELATNSIRYGGGGGTLRVWRERETVLCEIEDDGFIENPLAGRVLPEPDEHTGRGLWLANQLCDLVQIRSASSGNVVRMHRRVS
jgi:anti-sigma regulatory factor (Ser/Thr protein kinase)